MNIGDRVSLRSVEMTDYYVRHYQFRAWISKVTTPLDKADTTFIVRASVDPSRSSYNYSFESANFPGSYLAVKDGMIDVVGANDPAHAVPIEQANASFGESGPLAAYVKPPPAYLSQSGTFASFALDDELTFYVRFDAADEEGGRYRLKYQKDDQSDAFYKAASFEVVAGLSP